MAAPRTQVSGFNATLAQRLRSDGSDTSITLTVNANDPWSASQKGTAKFNTGDSSEWVTFTAVTINSSTSVTITGCTRGLDKDATSLTDATSTNKKNHPIGTPVRIVLHSADINKYVQNDADNTISGDNTLTGSNVCSSTSKAVLRLQNVTTAQRTALTGLGNGVIVYDTDLGGNYQYLGGSWYAIAAGSTQPDASTTVAGKVEIATSAEQIAMTATGGTGAALMVPNDSTERLLNGMHNSTSTQLRVGYNNTGSRAAEIGLYGDATYTSGSFLIQRGSTGANANTTMTHRGTGNMIVTLTDGGNFASSKPFFQTFTAGETISAATFVYYEQSTGKIMKAANTALNTANVLGFTITGGVLNDTLVVQTHGLIESGVAGLTDGSSYWLSTAGGMTATTPSHSSSSVVPVYLGKAVGTSKLLLDIRRVQRRTPGTFAIAAGTTTTTTLTVGYPVSNATFAYGTFTNGGTYPYDAGTGYFDAIGTAQGSAMGRTGSQTTYAIFANDMQDGAGDKKATASVNGSNNIELAWTETSYSASNGPISGTWIAYEKL